MIASDQSTLFLWQATKCLIAELAAELLERPDRGECLVILPTQRLCTVLLAALAKQLGTLAEPKITTMHHLINEGALTDGAGDDIAPPQTERQLRLMLLRMLEEKAWRYLRPGHERELLLLWDDFHRYDCKSFDYLNERILSDYHRDPAHLQSVCERNEEIAAFFAEFRRRYPEAQSMTSCQSALLSSWMPKLEAEESRFFSKITAVYAAGFTSMLPAEIDFWKLLARRKPVNLWLSQSPHIFAPTNPLAEMQGTFADVFLCKSFDSVPEINKTNQLVMVSRCRHRLAEADFVAQEVSRALGSGVRPHRIAILLADESRYADVVQSMAEKLPCPVNVAFATPLKTLPFSQLLLLLAELHRNPLALLLHPLVRPKLADDEAEHLIRNIADNSGEFDLTFALQKESSHYATLFPQLKTLFASLIESSKHTAQQFADAIDHLAERVNSVRSKEEQEQHRAIAKDLEQHFAAPCTARQYLEVFAAEVNQSVIRQIGEPLAAVQILSLAESRYVPFDLVFLMGCNEGLFPKSMPRDELLDNYQKKILGLPGWEWLEAREDLSFGLLKARIPQLVLTYSQQQIGSPLTPSRYIEILEQEGIASVDFLADRHSDHPLPARPKTHLFDTERLASMLAEFSATSLESLIQCPYRFLLSQLKVRPYPLPIVGPALKHEGIWLHKVLERYYESEHTDIHSANSVDQALDLVKELAPRGSEDTALFHHLRRFALPRFVAHLQVIYPSLEDWQQRSSQARELRLDPARPVAVGTRQLRVRGSIDSIDRFGTSLALLTDYKRRSFPERKNQLRGIAPQLSFYAYAFHAQFASEDASIADLAVGYWSILNGSWELLAAGSRIRDLIVAQNLGTKRCASLEELCTKMTDLWLWRLDQIEAAGSFAYDPSDCRQCPSKGICRKDDPGEKPYQKGLSTLNARYQTADEGSNEDESAESL